MDSTPDITKLLRRWEEGDASALDALMPIMYERLRQLARRRLREEDDESLNTTELVHETYLKLVESPAVRVQDRGHFLGLASRVMRHLLVDRARNRKAAKRVPISDLILQESIIVPDDALQSILELDQALERLAELNERRCRILEQRYFGALSLEEIAEALHLSLATVKRELRAARAWLAVELGRD